MASIAKPVAAQREPALRVATPERYQPDQPQAGGAGVTSGPKGVVLGGSFIENQVARLSDTRLPIRQRQALAAEIGRVQGNRQLQQVMAQLRENNGGTEMYSDPIFSIFSGTEVRKETAGPRVDARGAARPIH
jgi:hypothetical protein